MTSKTPRPVTRVAYLASAGYGQLRFTRHVYVDTRECLIKGREPEAWEHVFRCEETGEERRWGLEPRKVLPDFSGAGGAEPEGN